MPTASRPRAARATSYDVAQAAGVAQSTVSRCFQPGSHISDDTREHVLAVAARLGYAPNALARSLITRRSHAVGVLITRYTLRSAPALLYSLGDALARAGQHMILLAVDDDASVKPVLLGLRGYPLDGLIACATLDPAAVQGFTAHGVPVLFFNRSPGETDADAVSTDHEAGARALSEGMLGAGRRRFLCLGGPAAAPVGRLRIDGFQAGLRAAGLPEAAVLDGGFSYDQAHAVFVDAVARGARPDAIFCANDQMAMGVIDACRHELGWKIPDEVMVAGFDDVPEGARAPYRLTTVRQPIDAMARQAVELLRQRRATPERRPRRQRLPGEVIIRASAAWPG
ncbi:LacI family DNA-binding transcriptional regulator [Achromobacter sp.]|uniref:LacI family DNA-binding transcriptional regulator n=1 Tax=Achromobacter sp. TaxID=134375 RepID=UPI00258AA5FA|nr:LacI family DNA-binding transcriptional regulator [Achromobacter sp.]